MTNTWRCPYFKSAFSYLQVDGVWLGPLNVEEAFEKKDFEFEYSPSFTEDNDEPVDEAELHAGFLRAFECVFREYDEFVFLFLALGGRNPL